MEARRPHSGVRGPLRRSSEGKGRGEVEPPSRCIRTARIFVPNIAMSQDTAPHRAVWVNGGIPLGKGKERVGRRRLRKPRKRSSRAL